MGLDFPCQSHSLTSEESHIQCCSTPVHKSQLVTIKHTDYTKAESQFRTQHSQQQSPQSRRKRSVQRAHLSIQTVSKLVFYAQSTGAVISGRCIQTDWIRKQQQKDKLFRFSSHFLKSFLTVVLRVVL